MKKAKLTPRELGFVRVGAVVPSLKIGEISHNLDELEKLAKESFSNGSSITIFPELCITGYTVGDLFQQKIMIQKSLEGLFDLAGRTGNLSGVFIVGLPIEYQGALYNCAALIGGGEVLGIVPKSYLPNYSEFYEKRWFTEGIHVPKGATIKKNYLGQEIPFGTDIIFEDRDNKNLVLGIEICEDVWTVIKPSSKLALAGATILANLSASNEIVGKVTYRRDLVRQQSADTISAYVYTSSGPGESSTDLVFSGHAIIAENGSVLSESERFKFDSHIAYADIDIDLIAMNRRRNISFGESKREINPENFRTVIVNMNCYYEKFKTLGRNITKTPFVPTDEKTRFEITEEIFQIQATALATRMRNSNIHKLILGLSGGLDSTLSMLVAIRSLEILGLPKENLTLITMPGFGTTKKTKTNAEKLAEAFGIKLESISIENGSKIQLRDVGHDGEKQNVTFENVQARYRMMTLQDIANERGGLVLGTGDLSELALGWCTFGGDHTVTYNVNGGVPKTLVQHVVRYAGKAYGGSIEEVLNEILGTPISPELLRGDKDNPTQKTEDVVGPYELHDFFLFHFLRRGENPSKILYLAKYAFGEEYETETIRKWLGEFLKRFFSQQFKRSIIPDGPKVGSVTLSSRGDWRMPSDASAKMWIEELNNVII